MKDAAAVLSNIVREMESRYELMGMERARNLRDWNETRVAARASRRSRRSWWSSTSWPT